MPNETTVKHRAIGDAKARFAECIREVEAGATIVLTRHGRPVVRLEPLAAPRGAAVEDGASEEVREQGIDYEAGRARTFRSSEARHAALRRLLMERIWPRIPKKRLGKGIRKQEREEILGYGRSGV